MNRFPATPSAPCPEHAFAATAPQPVAGRAGPLRFGMKRHSPSRRRPLPLMPQLVRRERGHLNAPVGHPLQLGHPDGGAERPGHYHPANTGVRKTSIATPILGTRSRVDCPISKWASRRWVINDPVVAGTVRTPERRLLHRGCRKAAPLVRSVEACCLLPLTPPCPQPRCSSPPRAGGLSAVPMPAFACRRSHREYRRQRTGAAPGSLEDIRSARDH